ncbi:MAG: hypothetical protein MI866_06345 [Bacteroidales bacterium]|nr:hypothetical protein [Bacteroidales bacterium]
MKGISALYYYTRALPVISFFARHLIDKKQSVKAEKYQASSAASSGIKTVQNNISNHNEEGHLDKRAYFLCLICGLATIALMVLALFFSGL